jgi:hypothetical protein
MYSRSECTPVWHHIIAEDLPCLPVIDEKRISSHFARPKSNVTGSENAAQL